MKKSEITDAPVGKNDVLEIDIDGLGYNGEGIAHINGYTVFIRYALPGERVRAVVIFVKKTFAVGKLQSVLRPSPDRAEPFCPVYYKCGGCDLQHMTYAAQLAFKRRALKETFFKAGRLRVEPDEVTPSPAIKNYRNKMSLPVRGDGQIGFFASGTHRVVPIDDCPIQFEGNGKLITAFRAYMAERKIEGYNETTRTGAVRHLCARTLGGHTVVTAVANGKKYKDALVPFDKVLRGIYGESYAYYLNYNSDATNRILGDVSELIGGEDRAADIDGLKVAVHPQSFFQVNDGVRKILYREAAAEADGEDIVDAYSGAGVLGAILSRSARTVTAAEIEPQAVRSAEKMLKLNGITNVKTICGDCAEALPKILDGYAAQNKNPTVILDPPRTGCGRAVLDAVAHYAVRKLIYVSCNPATLASDLSYLLECSDYIIDRITPFDMFPQTANVETLVVLSHKKP